jgi:hypothetical protein
MPRFFFDLTDDADLTIDEEGGLLPDLEAMRKEAVRTLPQLAGAS